MSTAVLATKLFAPAVRSLAVARTRLVERLDDSVVPGQRLTLVSAPAGFGKTAVLSEWATRRSERHADTRVGWLSLDEDDNDLVRFLAHLVAALGNAGVELDPAAVLEPLPGDSNAALTALVNAVAHAGEREQAVQRVVVLDDYHVVSAPQIHEAMTFLLDHAPPQLHLMVATRADPPLALARLRSRGELVEVRGADLRFTPEEAGQFLTEAMGLDLDAAEVSALEERTEGWIAGLQLAALSLRVIPDRTGVADFIAAFTGSNRFVIDYLVDEVLARQRPDVRDFLVRTSVLDRLTGPLCDAVLDRPGGSAMLEEVERENLFLVPLDTVRTWYRYHHLFADVLQARLRSQDPDLAPLLHRRASDWYAERGLAADAVRHALIARDFTRAGYLVEDAVGEVRRARQDHLLLAWIRALPDEVVRQSPVLNIIAGWSRMVAGDLDGLEAALDSAGAALAAGSDHPGRAAAWAQTEDLRSAPATIQIYRASLAQARGDVDATVRHARHALELAGPEDHLVRGGAGGFLGLAAWAAGNIGEAIDTFSEAVRSLHAAGNLVDELDATVVLADMWLTAGRPSRARQLYEQALVRATGNGEPYPRAASDLHVGLADLDRELDDLVAAEAHLETARVLAERASITENRHRWPLVMAQVRAARGDLAAANRLLDEAAALYRHGFYPDVRPIEATRARILVATGDLDAATSWARRRGLTADDDADYHHEYEHLTLVRLLLAQHRASGDERAAGSASVHPAAAGTLLERLLVAATAARRDGSRLEIQVLQALVHHASGEGDEALDLLGRALSEAPEPDSHVRLYLDEGPAMLDLLRDAARRRVAPTKQQEAMSVWAGRMLERAQPQGRGTEQPLGDPLSQRELEVLRLLDSEKTGPQIAGELYVTVNTLRTHTKRIFTKLDVSTRAAAVRRGHEHGLI